MNIERRVRDIYERHPYPPPRSRMKATWSLPAVEWMHALRETTGRFAPKKILVAGCGVGTEVFTIAKQFPEAEIVGVDFSVRSIATANTMRPSKLARRVRFALADLTAPDLVNTTGDEFDFVTCHGVLSYIPDTPAVFRNFARVLAPEGILLLGVNGASHPSVRFRENLPKFGIAPEVYPERDGVRDVLRIFDCMIEYPRLPMADREAGYLAGDIFGPLNMALPLADWYRMLDAAQLHALGTYQAHYAARALFNHDLHLRVLPRSRRQMSELADALQPASFHQIVVSRRAPASIPWSDPKQLLGWRPARTRLFTFAWPRGSSAAHNLRTIVMKSKPTRTKVELNVPQWEVDALRQADGRRTLRELLANVKPRVNPKDVAEAMYLLYLMGAANLMSSEAM